MRVTEDELAAILRAHASQENADGEPFDTMMALADVLTGKREELPPRGVFDFTRLSPMLRLRLCDLLTREQNEIGRNLLDYPETDTKREMQGWLDAATELRRALDLKPD